MKRFLFTFSVLFILLASTFILWGGISIVKASSDIHQGDLILQGNNVTVIEGRFDINGSIIVEENATLILRNALVNFTQAENYQFRMIFQNAANGNPRLQSTNTTITSSNNRWFMVELLENSTATISNTTMTSYLNTRDSANASVSNSRIRFLVASSSVFLSVFNSTISYTLQTNGSPQVFVSNSSIAKVNLRLESVNCSISNFGPGIFPFWNYHLNCSATVSPDGYAPNITITHCTIDSWQLSFQGRSNATITNSTLSTLFSYYNTKIWLVNSTASHIQYLEGQVYVSWYLDVHVTDSIDQDILNANVTVRYQNATVAETKQTDANGLARLTLMEKMMNDTGEYPVGNYTVEAMYDIYSASTSINMTENKQITMKLEDFVIPEVPSFFILSLFMIATLIAVIVYRRKHQTRNKKREV